jgi:hypothetical protein
MGDDTQHIEQLEEPTDEQLAGLESRLDYLLLARERVHQEEARRSNGTEAHC